MHRSSLEHTIHRAHAALANDPQLACALAEEIRTQVERLGESRLVAELYTILGSARTSAGSYAAATADLERALDAARDLRDPALLVRIHRARLKCDFFTHEYARALHSGYEALRCAQESSNEKSEAMVRNDLGLLYGHLGEFEAALEHLLAGLRILRSDESARIGSLLNNIGNIYLEIDDLEEALNFYEEYLTCMRREEDPRGEAMALGNIGRAHFGRARFDKALRAFEQSEAIYDGAGDLVYLAPALTRTATALVALGRREEGRLRFRRAADLLAGEATPFREEVLYDLALHELAEGEAGSALARLEEVRAGFQECETTRRAYEVYLALSEAYELLGEHRIALTHFKEYHRIRQAMASSALNVGTRALMIEFDVERARQQQEIYRLRNVELARANEELQALHRRLQEKNRELHRLSVEDPLTGLHNRRYLDIQLDLEINRARRQKAPLCVALCDLDHFKETNDRFSHAVGDAVLRQVAVLLRQTTRTTDILARYGGDEFVVILPDTDLAGAEALIERLRASLAEQLWDRIAPGLHLTLSIGLRELREEVKGSELLAAADLRLYGAKHSGRDRVMV